MATEIKVPTLGESIVEATIGAWLKREGEQVNAGEAVVELETDKVNIEVTAEQSGTLQQIIKQAGDNVSIGDTIGMIAGGNGAGAAPPSDKTDSAQQPASTAQGYESTPSVEAETGTPQPEDRPTPSTAERDTEGARGGVSPVARRMAEEQGIDLRGVKGSGPGGRITKDDIAAQSGESAPAKAAAPKEAPKPAPAPAAVDGREERQRMSRRRQTIAQRLVEAQRTAAMLTTFNEVDMSAVMDLRKRRKDNFKERHGVNLGFMSFFTKAVIGALKTFPMLNAEIQGDEIVRKLYYDIGIAVSTEEGLVVPVVRDADRRSFAAIEREIGALATRARDGKLTISDLQGGTFTITNGGVFGSLLSTPILNAPQVGILGMHTIQERPVAVKGEIVIRPMMYIALSYDHRIVDGSTAVRFLVRIKELIEDPETLLLDG